MNKLNCFFGFHKQPDINDDATVTFTMSSTLDPSKLKIVTWTPCEYCGAVVVSQTFARAPKKR